MNVVEKIDNLIRIDNVLISVSDKKGLDLLVPGLIRINPYIRILSTGGTFKHIQGILGLSAEKYLTEVSAYTGQPETQGGLVKTLDFKIYLGLLTEKYNEAHQADLVRTEAVPIDMVVVNLYPFKDTIAKPDVTVEMARGNIDIGGPTMIRAAAKNYIRVASVVEPGDYATIINHLSGRNGCMNLAMRYNLGRRAFAHTAAYDWAIVDYLAGQTFDCVESCYNIQ